MQRPFFKKHWTGRIQKHEEPAAAKTSRKTAVSSLLDILNSRRDKDLAQESFIITPCIYCMHLGKDKIVPLTPSNTKTESIKEDGIREHTARQRIVVDLDPAREPLLKNLSLASSLEVKTPLTQDQDSFTVRRHAGSSNYHSDGWQFHSLKYFGQQEDDYLQSAAKLFMKLTNVRMSEKHWGLQRKTNGNGSATGLEKVTLASKFLRFAFEWTSISKKWIVLSPLVNCKYSPQPKNIRSHGANERLQPSKSHGFDTALGWKPLVSKF